MRYPFINYAASLGGNTCGSSKMFWINIRTDLKDNEGVYQHELTHVKQWLALALLGIPVYFGLIAAGYPQWANLALLSVSLKDMLYTLVPAFREWAEVQAYRKQITFGLDPYAAAMSLSLGYGLNITTAQALALLKA